MSTQFNPLPYGSNGRESRRHASPPKELDLQLPEKKQSIEQEQLCPLDQS